MSEGSEAPEVEMPRRLVLKDGGVLVKDDFAQSYSTEPARWRLTRDGEHIRSLDNFETEFIEAALTASERDREALRRQLAEAHTVVGEQKAALVKAEWQAAELRARAEAVAEDDRESLRRDDERH